jgi:soluble lytic murein transglycosylase-like protein
MRVESCFDPRAVSRTGARGLMQLMPETAAQFGVADSFDAEQNISGGVRYLSQLLSRFKNNTRLAIAAYNAGPSAVDAYRGIPPFPETRSYVKRVYAEYRSNSAGSPPKRSKI